MNLGVHCQPVHVPTAPRKYTVNLCGHSQPVHVPAAPCKYTVNLCVHSQVFISKTLFMAFLLSVIFNESVLLFNYVYGDNSSVFCEEMLYNKLEVVPVEL